MSGKNVILSGKCQGILNRLEFGNPDGYVSVSKLCLSSSGYEVFQGNTQCLVVDMQLFISDKQFKLCDKSHETVWYNKDHVLLP